MLRIRGWELNRNKKYKSEFVELMWQQDFGDKPFRNLVLQISCIYLSIKLTRSHMTSICNILRLQYISYI